MSRFSAPSTFALRSFYVAPDTGGLHALEGWSGSAFESSTASTEAGQSPASNRMTDESDSTYLFVGQSVPDTPNLTADSTDIDKDGPVSLSLTTTAGQLVVAITGQTSSQDAVVTLNGSAMTSLGVPANDSTFKQTAWYGTTAVTGTSSVLMTGTDNFDDNHMYAVAVGGEVSLTVVPIQMSSGHFTLVDIDYDLPDGGLVVFMMTNGKLANTTVSLTDSDLDTLTAEDCPWAADVSHPPALSGYVQVDPGGPERTLRFDKPADVNWCAAAVVISRITVGELIVSGAGLNLYARTNTTNQTPLGLNTGTLTPAEITIPGVGDVGVAHEWELEFRWRLRRKPRNVPGSQPVWSYTLPATLDPVAGVPGNTLDTYYSPSWDEISILDQWITTTFRLRSVSTGVDGDGYPIFDSFDALGSIQGGAFPVPYHHDADGADKWPLQFSRARVSGPYPVSKPLPDLRRLGTSGRGAFQ